MLKKCKVVMLSTNEKTDILYWNKYKNLSSGRADLETLDDLKWANVTCQHLYIISNDEIKMGDWRYNSITNNVSKAANNYKNQHHLFKIIATTDKSLVFKTEYDREQDISLNLPQPSESFINKYIEQYNRSNIIEDVLVEYEEKAELRRGGQFISNVGTYTDGLEFYKEPKINSKDNTITIKKVKDSWELNFNQLMQIFDQGFKYYKYLNKESNCIGPSEYLNKWIEENL